ncbi:MAG TPA: phospholipase D-like domain-containing protein [Burkholderiales bacterium]|nr:phospholipase D-like domain-containing protein [Burkholderiales bacterium]
MTLSERDLRAYDPNPSPLRVLAEQAFSRAAGAPLVGGNSVRIRKDADENYPAWLDAIRGARHKIFFENYIVADDAVGRDFVKALAHQARLGVRVYALYDWMGGLGATSRKLWRPLIEAGGIVRCFNPPRIDSPFAWLTRDHRKMITVDGEVGFVSGLCVSRKWQGDAARRIEPWRDTGIEVRGPAVADIEAAFAEMWAITGEPLPQAQLTDAASISAAGDVMLRVLASVPNLAGLYRLDQLIAAMASKTLWLTDAYFVGISPYVQALRAAAFDGVDVRLLVPGASDLPMLSRLSRTGYRALLEAGIRVFEWNGPMLHAKSAVADGRWARIGSTNLNIASWIGNYELDIAIEDARLAQQMEALYEQDLAHATEIVLGRRRGVHPTVRTRRRARRRTGAGSAARAAAGALRIGNTVGAAITNRRVLGPAEAGIMTGVAFGFLGFAIVGLWWPAAIAWPLVALAGWVAVALLIRAHKLRHQPPDESGEPPGPPTR